MNNRTTELQERLQQYENSMITLRGQLITLKDVIKQQEFLIVETRGALKEYQYITPVE